MICVTPKTDNEQIVLEDNSLVGASGGQQPLPTRFFRKLSCCDCDDVCLQGDWQQRSVPGCFSGQRLESEDAGASATFSW